MASRSWHSLSLIGALAVVTPQAASGSQSPPGLVVLHFASSGTRESAGACRLEAKNKVRERTLFREHRTADGSSRVVTGRVALRFKAATSARQIDSLIAAMGIEVFTAAGPACRRYILAVAQPGGDAAALANAVQHSGLVEYATPDDAAGRSEGVRSDSFFVDQVALSNAVPDSPSAVDAAPSKYAIGQVLSAYTGPLMRVDGPGLAALMSSVNSSASAVDLVKTHGLTTLRVDVPQRSAGASVRVVLYTLTGAPVRQLVSETLDAGRYVVGWDGNDDRGRRVQPGVYVAVMTAGNFRETRRLVIR